MSTVLAGPPEDGCCKNAGFIHQGEPKGETIELGGLKTYVSHPPRPTDKIILVFPDVHGPFHINNQLVMDYFASQGFLIVALDYFEGEPIQLFRDKPGFDHKGWIDKTLPRAKEIAPAWVEAVFEKFGTPTTNYGTVGYCFGAPFVLEICATNKVKAGAIAHPAFINEEHFRNIKQPLLLSCSEEDQTFPSESRHISEKILAEIHAKYFYQLFSGVKHGFALRGNMEVEHERWAKEQSAYGIVNWWNRFLI